MGQYWEIFNLTTGKVMPVHDGSKYCEKHISLDVLLFLLQNEWKDCEITMIGDYDDTEKCAEFTRKFLEHYDLTSHRNNLYTLDADGILPKSSYETSFYCNYMNANIDYRVMLYLESISKTKSIYFILDKWKLNEKSVIEWKAVETTETYAFINHTAKEYILFDQVFFAGFYDRRTKKPLTMTIVKYNNLVKSVVKGLIVNKSEYQDKISWHGRWSGHSLSFSNVNDFNSIDSYTNMSNIFTDKKSIYDEDFDDILYTLDPKSDLDLSDEEE
jgi:hypothetical protein